MKQKTFLLKLDMVTQKEGKSYGTRQKIWRPTNSHKKIAFSSTDIKLNRGQWEDLTSNKLCTGLMTRVGSPVKEC